MFCFSVFVYFLAISVSFFGVLGLSPIAARFADNFFVPHFFSSPVTGFAAEARAAENAVSMNRR